MTEPTDRRRLAFVRQALTSAIADIGPYPCGLDEMTGREADLAGKVALLVGAMQHVLDVLQETDVAELEGDGEDGPDETPSIATCPECGVAASMWSEGRYWCHECEHDWPDPPADEAAHDERAARAAGLRPFRWMDGERWLRWSGGAGEGAATKDEDEGC